MVSWGNMKSLNEHGYNERLFSSGLRSKLHFARFNWVRSICLRHNYSTKTVLELGCFDGKLIKFLPEKPIRYVGFDANWEGGLDLAKAQWAGEPAFAFFKATSPAELSLTSTDIFDLAVSMETLEHISPGQLDDYLLRISQHLNGHFLVTVPNEKGVVFLCKWLVKRLLSKDAERYSFSELVNATMGRMQFVERREHKGFDYDLLIKQLSKHFDVIEVGGHPFGYLPHSLCFGIGIVAKSKGQTILPHGQ